MKDKGTIKKKKKYGEGGSFREAAAAKSGPEVYRKASKYIPLGASRPGHEKEVEVVVIL